MSIANYVVWRTLRDQLPMVQHHQALRDRKHDPHQVLDHDDGHAEVCDGGDHSKPPAISAESRPALTSSSMSTRGFIAKLLASSRRLRRAKVSVAAGRSARSA